MRNKSLGLLSRKFLLKSLERGDLRVINSGIYGEYEETVEKHFINDVENRMSLIWENSVHANKIDVKKFVKKILA